MKTKWNITRPSSTFGQLLVAVSLSLFLMHLPIEKKKSFSKSNGGVFIFYDKVACCGISEPV